MHKFFRIPSEAVFPYFYLYKWEEVCHADDMQINRTVYHYYSLNQWSLQTKFREYIYISKILGNIDPLLIWGKDDKPSITDDSGTQACCSCVVISALGFI